MDDYIGDSANPLLNEDVVGKITDTYRDHPNVVAIKSSDIQNSKFTLPHATTQGINKIINSLSSDKAKIQKMLKLQMLDLFSKKVRKIK